MRFKNGLDSQIGVELPAEMSSPLAARENFLYGDDWAFRNIVNDDLDGARW